MTYIFMNGKTVLAAEAKVSVQDRGFRYGDGVFDTIRVHAHVPYQFDWHMERLTRGLAALKMTYDVELLQSQCRTLLNLNQLCDGLLRIQITRGIGSYGYLPDAHHPLAGPTCVIETLSLPAVPSAPVSLWVSNWQRISREALPTDVKLCQGVNATLARLDAQEHGCFEALQCNHKQKICETSSGNIFWLKDGSLYTPSSACGILKGSMRAAVLRISPYPVIECEASIDVLADAEAVFIANASWKLLAVGRLHPDHLHWESQAIVTQLNALLSADMLRHSRELCEAWV